MSDSPVTNTVPSDPLIAALRTISDNVSNTGNWITPVAEALTPVGLAEAVWKPSPTERSIAEIAAHMASWTEWTVHFVQGRDTDVTDWPVITDLSETKWQELQLRLTQSQAELRAQIARFSPAELFAAPTPEVTPTNRLLGVTSILIHNAYHAGQITKLHERYTTVS